MTETEYQQITDNQYEQLISLLEQHDWNYIDASDIEGFRRGSTERSAIELMVRTIGTPEAKFIYTAYKTAYTRH